jgi:hypothetical protein
MSCRRIRRELLWLVRFGELDAGSARHLDHLAGCQECRDEIGLDRALVRQLRTALAERIGDATPSPSAWEGVLARMRQPEPSVRPWPVRLAALLRAGSAMAGAGLALVLALNLEMVPIGAASPALDVETITASSSAGRGAGLRHWEGRAPATGTAGVSSDATVAFVPTATETLPPSRTSLEAVGPDPDAAPTNDPSGGQLQQGPAVVLHFVPVDAAALSGDDGDAADEPGDDQPAAPAVPPVGGPS